MIAPLVKILPVKVDQNELHHLVGNSILRLGVYDIASSRLNPFFTVTNRKTTSNTQKIMIFLTFSGFASGPPLEPSLASLRQSDMQKNKF